MYEKFPGLLQEKVFTKKVFDLQGYSTVLKGMLQMMSMEFRMQFTKKIRGSVID